MEFSNIQYFILCPTNVPYMHTYSIGVSLSESHTKVEFHMVVYVRKNEGRIRLAPCYQKLGTLVHMQDTYVGKLHIIHTSAFVTWKTGSITDHPYVDGKVFHTMGNKQKGLLTLHIYVVDKSG